MSMTLPRLAGWLNLISERNKRREKARNKK
jgi:hypothetical protein